MTLIDDLADYDGKRVALLESIAARYAEESEALAVATRLVTTPDGHVAAGASWLVRRWLSAGRTLDADEIRSLGRSLGDVPDPWARLHLCQAMASLDVPPDVAEPFFAFLSEATESPRPFLRAWGTDGLVRLAERHPRFDDAARRALERAAADPAASVRARARRILAESM